MAGPDKFDGIIESNNERYLADPEVQKRLARSAAAGSAYQQLENGAQQYAVDQAFLVSQMSTLCPPGTADRSRMAKIINIASESESGVLNKLNWVPGAYDFMKMEPYKISELMPLIKISKVLYSEDGDATGEVDFEFDNTMDPNMLSDTTDGGVGIQSFEYRYVGSNPATVRNDIEAKLILYFQNFSEMLRPRSGHLKNADNTQAGLQSYRARYPAENDPQTQVPENSPSATIKKTDEGEKFDDALAECSEPKDIPRRAYGSSMFEIKAEVGWADASGASSTLNLQQKEALETSRQALFLTLIDHDFTFEDDGSFTLELNYRARLSAVLESPISDILRLNEEIEGDGSIGGVNRTKTWTDAAGLQNVYTGTAAEQMQQLKKELEKAIRCCDTSAQKMIKDHINRLYDEVRGDKYRQVGQYLLNAKLLKNVRVSAATMNSWANTANPGAVELEGLESNSDIGEVGDMTQEDLNESLRPVTDETEETTWFYQGETTRIATWEKLLNDPRDNAQNVDNESYYDIPFFAFGDLLSHFANSALDSDDADEKIKLLMGSISVNTGSTNESGMQTMLIDIPISWYTFRNFWHNKVVKPRREKYPLLQFIRDALRELILGSLNSVYWTGDGQASPNKFQIRTAYISLPANTGEGMTETAEPGDPVVNAMNAQGRDATLSKTVNLDVFKEDSPIAYVSSKKPSLEVYNYMVIFVEKGDMGIFRKDRIPEGVTRRDYNRSLNIHHFGFGEDRGMLKTASFSKTTQPYLRESRYLEDGYNPFQQLSNVYDVELILFGSPFFYPGQYIWIDPYGLSKSATHRLGSPDKDSGEGEASAANIMGIGGYHIIISVAGMIESGQYEMKIKARYDNSGANVGERPGFGMNAENKCPDASEPTPA